MWDQEKGSDLSGTSGTRRRGYSDLRGTSGTRTRGLSTLTIPLVPNGTTRPSNLHLSDLFTLLSGNLSFSQFVSVFSTFKLFVPINGELINAGSWINFWTFSQTHISKSELKSAHISRFCTVFQVNQVISSAKFASAEEVDLSFNS